LNDPHCRSIFPAFLKLGADFAGDASVIIAALNCTRDGSLCGKLGVHGYPMIWTYFRGIRQSVNGRSYDAFSAAVGRLKTLAAVGPPRTMTYPAFAFRMRADDAMSRAIADKIAADAKLPAASRVFFDFADLVVSITVYLSANHSLQMADAFTQTAVARFVADHPVRQLGIRGPRRNDATLRRVLRRRRG
jgi:hypothetical protein